MNKKTTKIDPKTSVYIKFLHQEQGVSCKDIKKRFPKYALRSIYRHAKKPLSSDGVDHRKFNKGRPKILTKRDERKVVRAVYTLRQDVAAFTAKRIQVESQTQHVNTKTVRRCLKKNGFGYRHSRKKGLVSKADKNKRIQFARTHINSPKDQWTNKIKFYLDGVGFAHKTNPHGEARAHGTMQWRKANEGLSRTCKGKKEGSGGKMANFYVAVAYNKGVVLCEQYTWTPTGEKFANFIKEHFPETFKRCGATGPQGETFLQDGDPRQVSAAARKAWEQIGCKCFRIPARSPDLNPIENVFNLVRNQLREDSMKQQIQHETYQEFCNRVKRTLEEFPTDIIDKTIDSMGRRLHLIMKGKGNRTKY